jgi:dihydroorotase
MSKITIVEAAKQFNVTRPRIYRSIRKGELSTTLSDDGVQLVQVQDMIRLFDNVPKKDVRNVVQNGVSDTELKLVKLLEEQLKKAEDDKAFLKQQINDLRKDFDEYKLRIEHQSSLDPKIDITSNEHDQETESLQVEHGEKRTSEQPVLEKPKQEAENKPIKKGLLRRLVDEFLK